MLEISGLSKVYNPGDINEVPVFKNFSLNIKKGEFVTVIGSNGSGKTSLLNLICGSMFADSGQINLDGVNITFMKEYLRMKQIGRVFQDPSRGTCPSMTILENMALAENKSKMFGLGLAVQRKKIDFYKTQLERLKLGLQDKIYTQVGSLSGGQRQALALLVSTMTPIKLLILDEHTAALDPKTCEGIMELTDEIIKEQDITTLMVTHNLKYAITYGSRLIMMHKGEAILDVSGEGKSGVGVNDVLDIFNEISLEYGNSV